MKIFIGVIMVTGLIKYSKLELCCSKESLYYYGSRCASSAVEWLEGRECDRHGPGSKPTRTILLCPWQRHFRALSAAWWSWQTVVNYNHISIKFQAHSYILASPEAGRGNCLFYALVSPSLSCD